MQRVCELSFLIVVKTKCVFLSNYWPNLNIILWQNCHRWYLSILTNIKKKKTCHKVPRIEYHWTPLNNFLCFDPCKTHVDCINETIKPWHGRRKKNFYNYIETYHKTFLFVIFLEMVQLLYIQKLRIFLLQQFNLFSQNIQLHERCY